MVIDFKPAGEPGTRAEFSYDITPATISITGKGQLSVGKDLEAVFAQNRILASSPYHQFSIMARHRRCAWHGVQWDGKTATSFPLNETDEKKANLPEGKDRGRDRGFPWGVCLRFKYSSTTATCESKARRKRPGDAECENSIMKVPKEVFRGCQVTDHSSILAPVGDNSSFESVASAN